MYININKKSIIIWSMCLFILVIIIIYFSFMINKIKYGNKIVLENNKINLTNYYTEYDVTVVSNKNINTYFVKEWYKEGVGIKSEYLDYTGNTYTVINTPTAINISSTNNKAQILIYNTYEKDNVLSLTTYINIFNKDIICNCTKNIYEKTGEINIHYSICGNEKCMQTKGIKEMGITGFELNVKGNTPITYMVYTGNEQPYASILYSKFESNIVIDDGLFKITN